MLGPPLLPQRDDRIMCTLILEVVCLRAPDKAASQKCVNLNKKKQNKHDLGGARKQLCGPSLKRGAVGEAPGS